MLQSLLSKFTKHPQEDLNTTDRQKIDVIAHDLANLLCVINGNIGLIEDCIDDQTDSSQLRRIVDRLSDVEDRGGRILASLYYLGTKAHTARS